MKIRTVTEIDAEDLYYLMRQLATESSFMMFELDEVPTPEMIARRLSSTKTTEQMLVAEEGADFLGYLTLSGGNLRRNKGVGTLTVGVGRHAQGNGVGSELMEHAIVLGRETGLYRLQLYVQTTNFIAIKLYRKFSFEVEGTLRGAVKINGQLVDKFLMAKLL